MTRDMNGKALTPGINVDPIDVTAGLRVAATIGYDDTQARIVVLAALQRHQRGEEAGAQKLWLSEYPRDLTSWYIILAAAIAAATTPDTGKALAE